MRNTMLDWIEAADARLACERPAVVLIMRRPRIVPVFYAGPIGVLVAVMLLALGC